MNKGLGISSPAPSFDQYDIQVLISASMPDASLRALFAQAEAYGADKVRFVIRGFEPKQLAKTISHFRRFFPDPAKDFVIVEIDPNTFRAVGAQSVPVYLVKNDQKQWWEARGELSLTGAMNYVRNPNNKLVAGPLYPVKEPDMLALLENEGRKENWAGVQRRMEQQAMNPVIESQASLPLGGRNQSRTFTPTVPLPEDVVASDPRTGGPVVLARAGQGVNPLAHSKIDKTIMVIAAGDERQLRWAKKLIDKEPKRYDVFFVGKADLREIAARLSPASVFPLYEVFKQGFGVQSTPSILRQQGQSFGIQEFNAAELKG